MSLLSGKDIQDALAVKDDPSRRLVITPLFDSSIQVVAGTTSIDLRLGCRFSAARRRRLSHFTAFTDDETNLGGADLQQLVDEYYVPLGGRFVLHPHHFVLATTLEWIRLPPIYGGYILGRSVYGRRGLIIATASGVHPSYSGVLTLELTNVAEVPLEVRPGQSLCQLFLHTVLTPKMDQRPGSFVGSLYPRLGRPSSSRVDEFLLKGAGMGAEQVRPAVDLNLRHGTVLEVNAETPLRTPRRRGPGAPPRRRVRPRK